MPELPDVEVYRRRLAHHGLHRRITRVRVPDPTVLREVSTQALVRALRGHALVATDRRGKHLFAASSGKATLVMHFGMTGVLQVDDRPEAHPYERLALEFEDGGVLTIADPRKLGFVTVVDDVVAYCREHDLGPDALTLTAGDLRRLLRGHRRRGVKALLMDQSLLAGIGNIYSDEILFQARIDPRRRVDSLDDAAVRRLHRQLSRVLRLAADRSADVSRFPEGWLLPSREAGAPCPRGDGEIRKARLVGRSAYYCPGCQH